MKEVRRIGRRRNVLKAVIGLLCCLGMSRPAAAEGITWLFSEFPPIFITSQLYSGEGFADQQLRLLIGQMPDYQHVIRETTAGRLWYQIAHEDGVCTSSAGKTPEREAVAIFSRFGYWAQSNRLLIRAGDSARFKRLTDASGAVDLALLAKNTSLTGAYAVSRTYGRAIDSFIADPTRKTRMTPLVHLRHPLILLDKGRVDFIFGYAIEAAYYRELYKVPGDFEALPIKGDVSHQFGFIACSKGPRGQKIIERIDEILQHDDVKLRFLEPLRRWYGPDDFAAALAAKESDH